MYDAHPWLPSDDPRSPGQSAAEASEQYEVLWVQLVVTNRMVEGDGQRGGRGVSESLNDGADPVGGNRQTCRELRKDPSIRLMNDKLGDVPQFYPELLEGVPQGLFQTLDRQPKQRRPFHAQQMVLGLQPLFRHWPTGATGVNPDQIVASAVGVQPNPEYPPARLTVCPFSLHNDRTGAVAEQ